MKLWVCIFLLWIHTLYAGFFFPDKKPVLREGPRMDITYEKSEAFSLLNEIREAMGMNTLSYNEQLTHAAQAHADYLIRNHTDSHDEVTGLPEFTGVKPVDRAWHAGYLSSQVSENLSTQNRSAKESIDGLFSAIYHRFGFLDVSIDEIGVGVTQDAREVKYTAFVYLMGNSALNALCHDSPFKGYGYYVYHVCRDQEHRISQKHFDKAKNSSKWLNPKIILYPYDGQEDVPPAFYAEIPDPLPDYDVSGFPVSVIFNEYFFHKVKLKSFDLYDDTGKKVTPVRVLSHETDPHKKFTRYQFALFPLKRLKYDTEYHARVIYTYKKRKYEKRWSFHTRKPLEQLIRISKPQETVILEKGKSYLLYFVPLDAHDVLKDIVFPDDIDLSFIDNNTLKIKIDSGDIDDFTLRSGKRVLHVKMKDSY
jgi:hypothetical protein